MKNFFKMLPQNRKVFYFLPSILFFVSCSNNSENLNEDISKDFLLSPDSLKENANELAKFEKRFETIANLNQNIKLFDKMLSDSTSSTTTLYKRVQIAEAIGNIFNPDNHPCALPDKIKRKLLKKIKDEKKEYAPKEVTNFINRLPQTATAIPGTSLSAFLHTITIRKKSHEISEFPLLSVPTFSKFNVQDFIVKTGYDSFFYALDCSGYMNAAIEMTGTALVADMNSSASSALKSDNSLFVGGGTLISPVYSSIYPVFGSGIDSNITVRIKILEAILAIPNINEDDSIQLSPGYEVVWASKEGKSKFNGTSDIQGRIGAGLGTVSFSTTANGGATLSKEISFNTYDTYISSEIKLGKPEIISIKRIKEILNSLRSENRVNRTNS